MSELYGFISDNRLHLVQAFYYLDYAQAKGRQLQSMSKSGTSVSFTYNEDGLRVGKNVNGTVTTYVLYGKNVVHLTQGSNNLHFFYGADGSPQLWNTMG